MSAASSIPVLPSGKLLGHAGLLRDDTLGALRLAMEAGDLVRLRVATRHVVVVSSPALALEVLVERAQDYRKSRGLRVFAKPITGNGLLVSENPVHRRRRSMVAPAFQAGRIAQYAEEMVEATERFLSSLQGRARIDLTEEMATLTLHIAAKTLFSTHVEGDVRAIGKALELGARGVIKQVRAPFQLPSFLPTPSVRDVRDSAQLLDEVVMRIIRERRAAGALRDKRDLLSRLMTPKDPETDQPLTDGELRDEVLTLLLAGHETSANALTWSLGLLSEHPHAAARLQQEVADVLRGRPPRFEDLSKLPYALAVFKEAMRLYPPAYMITRNALVETQLGGHTIAPDQLVFVNIYGMHRRAEPFAKPDLFRPERFLDGQEKLWPKGTYLPFGAGPRVCVGNHFALMEGQLILARLAQTLAFAGSIAQLPDGLPLITLRPKQKIEMHVKWLEAR